MMRMDLSIDGNPVKVQIVSPVVDLLTSDDEIRGFPKRIELAGRTCYKSQGKITSGSADGFVRKLRRLGHESVLEHCSFSVVFVGSRSMSHQLVRHRLAAYSQESQRYCNYGKFQNVFGVICPPSVDSTVDGSVLWSDDGVELRITNAGDLSGGSVVDRWSSLWYFGMSCLESYWAYLKLLGQGVRPEDARELLPNAARTEVVTTYNLRQWRHFFRTRCDAHAQWQIRGLALAVLERVNRLCPSVFEDLADEFLSKERGL